MNKTTEALKLAEEALVKANHFHDYEDALAAIREALAEQSKCACDSPTWCTKYKKCNREMLGLPKAEPVKQEPVCNALTDSEREKYEEKIKGLGNAITRQFNAAEELASRVMELEESMEQEPVFWYRPINEEIYEGPVHNDSVCGKMWRDEKPGEWLPLYAAPVSAKREWVDLTEGEQEAIYLKCNTPSEYTNAVIAAFKEKNK